MATQITSERTATSVQNMVVNCINLDIQQGTVQEVGDEPELGKCRFRAINKWIDGAHNCSSITGFTEPNRK